jgi:phospholipid/cholesterol/gamma-HCH transport system substrate-binding protein
MAEVKNRRQGFVQLGVLAAFLGLCAVVFGYLWVNSGGKLPFISKAHYQISADIPRVGNLVYFSDVAVNGVLIGKVQALTAEGDHAHVVMDLTKYAPVHEGAKVRVRAKTLVEESFLEIEDGTGPALPSGAALPKDAGIGPTQLNDVLLALDGKTRGALADASKSLGAATVGTRQAFSDAIAGLGAIGRGGHDALDALAAQSEDLRALSSNTATLLTALNTQRGEIAQLVTDANQLTTATADGKDDLAQFMRELPPTLKSVDEASDGIDRIGKALDPVAKNLHRAAPDLTVALQDLPDVSKQLRGLLPALDGVLASGPDTFDKVGTFSKDMEDFTPAGEDLVSELNPMLGYIKGYKRETGAVLANFAQTLAHGDANGKFLQAMLLFGNETAVKAFPVNTEVGPLDKYNPYPSAGQGYNPSGVGRNYDKLYRESPH